MNMRLFVIAALVLSMAAFAQNININGNTNAIPVADGPAATPAIPGNTNTYGYEGDWFQVRYASNLLVNGTDSVINLTNTGAYNGYDPAGRICVNVYAFDFQEELVSCCSCELTPNALQSISVKNSLISNVLTPTTPSSITIKLIANAPFKADGTRAACDPRTPSATNLVPGMRAWGTTVHQLTASPVTYGVTETEFSKAKLSASELQKSVALCAYAQFLGSGFGVCKSCQNGGLGAGVK